MATLNADKKAKLVKRVQILGVIAFAVIAFAVIACLNVG